MKILLYLALLVLLPVVAWAFQLRFVPTPGRAASLYISADHLVVHNFWRFGCFVHKQSPFQKNYTLTEKDGWIILQ